MKFGSDGTSIRIDKQNEVVACLKKKINHFLTFIYCVTYMTNLAAIDATKVGPCKDMSREINMLLNSIEIHFKKLYKKKMHCFYCKKNLQILQSV